MMFKVYDRKDKIKFISFKALVLFMIMGALILAVNMANVEIPTVSEKMRVGFGMGLVLIVGVLASFNVVGSLFKFKSIGFLVIFLILLLLKSAIDVLIISLGLVLIPLIINDLVIDQYFKFVNMNKYWDKYKFIIAGKNEEG